MNKLEIETLKRKLNLQIEIAQIEIDEDTKNLNILKSELDLNNSKDLLIKIDSLNQRITLYKEKLDNLIEDLLNIETKEKNNNW